MKDYKEYNMRTEATGDPLVLKYEVADDISLAGSASSDVKKQLRLAGASSEIQRNVSICMYEGEINMVIHADGGEITVEIFDNLIRMALSDHGPGIKDVQSAMKEGWSTASENARNLGFGAGMGLPNMKKHSDYMNIDTQVGVGTTVTMEVLF